MSKFDRTKELGHTLNSGAQLDAQLALIHYANTSWLLVMQKEIEANKLMLS